MIKLKIPTGWYNVVRGRRSVPFEVSVTLKVFGLVMTFSGQATHHELIDANSGAVEKIHLKAKFTGESTASTVKLFSSEEALSAYSLSLRGEVRLERRIRLPRMDWYRIFWPPSARLHERISSALAAGTDPNTIDLAAMDPPSLVGMWEPVTFTPSLRRFLEVPLE